MLLDGDSPGCRLDAAAIIASDESTSAAHNRIERVGVGRAMADAMHSQRLNLKARDKLTSARSALRSGYKFH